MANLQLIKDFAEKKNISLVSIASRLGISVQQLHSICKKNSTKLTTLEEIARILEVPMSVFFEDDPNRQMTIHTEGDYSPGYTNGDYNVNGDLEVLKERIRGLEALVKEKDRIIELYERNSINNCESYKSR